MSELYNQVKRKLNVTWEDAETTARINDIISSAIPTLIHKLGITDTKFDFSAAGLEHELFLSYCLYEWNHVVNEFDENYHGEIAVVRQMHEVDQYSEGGGAGGVDAGGVVITDEQIQNAVNSYLDANPVEVPVQSVNGQTGDVKLSAADVGAISQDALQGAVDDALAQAKESGEFKGDSYVLTETDKTEIAQQAASLVDTSLLSAIGSGVIE